MSDTAYMALAKRSLPLLIEGVKGDFASIPDQYLEYLAHEYSDGDISLLPALSRLEGADELEPWQFEEVLEALGKVDPNEWPDLYNIESIFAPGILDKFSETLENEDELQYVEDNLGTSEKTQKVLKGVIESVFGEPVEKIRSRQGKFPSQSNNFLQEKDGTFAGTFQFKDHLFEFEIAPTERGWICTYRLTEGSLDKLEKPQFKQKKQGKVHHRRKVRSQGWR